MKERELPIGLVPERRTPLFDVDSIPAALRRPHRTTVWARIHVEQGTVRFLDLQGDDRRDLRLEAGDSAVIEPDVEHQVEPSTDARFYVQFYRRPDEPIIPTPTEEARGRGGRRPAD